MTNNDKILAFPDTAAIEAEAAAWVARFDAGDVSARDQARFHEWLNRSALHRQAIAEYGTLWSEFDALRTLAAPGGATRQSGLTAIRPAMLESARPWLAACAAVVIAVGAGAVLFHPKLQDSAVAVAGRTVPQPKLRTLARVGKPAENSYETAVGNQRKIILADGSSVLLNTNSRLDVDFSGNRRNVHLVRGEAFFEVVHDGAHPFTVYANNYVVRDIGTAFDVHLAKKGRVEVGVTKGSVEVAKDARIADAAKSLGVITAGHNIVLGPDVERAEIVSSADMGRKLAWRQGELIYTGQPLGEVLADVSRYSDIKIELVDPTLESLPVGGAFRTDQIEAIFAALENNFGIHAEWIDAQHVRFTASGEKSSAKD